MIQLPKLTVTQQVRLTLPDPIAKDRKGNPAPIDGIPTWASSDESQALVVPDANGLSALVVGHGPSPDGSSYVITCSADADMTEAVETLTLQATGSVGPGKATALGDFNIGAVEEQP